MLGPNGAGKTTLLSAIAGLVKPDAGEIRVMGVNALVEPKSARQRLGFAPGRVGISPTFTVQENLVFFGQLAGLSRSTATSRAADVAEAVRLGGLLRRRAGGLSGGEQRRVHVACALLHSPPLLLLDEPTSGVDVFARRAVLELVRGLARRGTAVCQSTHNLAEAEELGSSVAILDHGRVIARDDLARLVARHGRTVIEVRFDGSVPPLPLIAGAQVNGSLVRISTDDPGRTLAHLLPAIGRELPRVQSVDVLRPGLESVFLALTGARYSDPNEERR